MQGKGKGLNLRLLTSTRAIPLLCQFKNISHTLPFLTETRCMRPRGTPITSILITTPCLGSELCMSPASLPVLQYKGFWLLVTSRIACLSPSSLSDLLAPRAAQQATDRGQHQHHSIKLVPVPSDEAFVAMLLWQVSTETRLVGSSQDFSQVQDS